MVIGRPGPSHHAQDPVSGHLVGEPARITPDAAPKFGLALSHCRRKLAHSTYSEAGSFGRPGTPGV
jgi:hypothetical protein